MTLSETSNFSTWTEPWFEAAGARGVLQRDGSLLIQTRRIKGWLRPRAVGWETLTVLPPQFLDWLREWQPLLDKGDSE